ncbi:MAG TPA: thioesterase family protein [Bacteroidia bacterium]|nr:thioesterase family protein [Bacteroidia bacterium]
MITSEIKIRVRYAETDQMGFVYYGRYAEYYEIGRVETMRKLSLSYKEMEEKGILMPVIEYHIEYKKPAFYDDELILITTIKELPKLRITFHHEMFNSNGQLLNTGYVTLVFLNKETKKPVLAPDWFLNECKKFF